MRAVIAAERATLGTPLRRVLNDLGVHCGANDCISYAGLAGGLAGVKADVVLVQIGTAAAGLVAIQQAVRHALAPVLAVGPRADSRHLTHVLVSGAAGYLEEARLREELLAALDRLDRARGPAPPGGRTYAVVGAAPGSGVTTVAGSLAFALAGLKPHQVLLAELGPGVPELALSLGLEPRHGTADLLEKWERLDGRLLRPALHDHPAGLSILAHPPETLEADAPRPEAVRPFVLVARNLFAHTVLDLGHSACAGCSEAMALADAVFLVLRLDVPALRLARKFVRTLADHGVPRDRLHTVANRYGQRQQVDPRRAEQVLGLSVPVAIPDDPAAVNRALNEGHPLVQSARGSAITRSFNQLARQLTEAAR